MDIAKLVFVGFNSRVVALDRDTGQVVWDWKATSGSGYVTLMLDADRLIVSVVGYTYCLDPATGAQMWFNPLRGYGVGVASLASVNGGSVAGWLSAAEAAEEDRRRRQSAT